MGERGFCEEVMDGWFDLLDLFDLLDCLVGLLDCWLALCAVASSSALPGSSALTSTLESTPIHRLCRRIARILRSAARPTKDTLSGWLICR